MFVKKIFSTNSYSIINKACIERQFSGILDLKTKQPCQPNFIDCLGTSYIP